MMDLAEIGALLMSYANHFVSPLNFTISLKHAKFSKMQSSRVYAELISENSGFVERSYLSARRLGPSRNLQPLLLPLVK